MIRLPDSGADWFRNHAVGEILPRWLNHAVTPSGFFQPWLDRQWHPREEQAATLVSQGRLLHNFARGWELTRRPEYRDAVESGSRFLVESFQDRKDGGWFWSVGPDGRPADTAKDTYGHAFALFGLSYAYKATGAAGLREAALDVWAAVDTHLRDGSGGFFQRTDREFGSPTPGRSINPLMHLVEALLAAGELLGEPSLHKEAARTADFVLRLARPEDGLLREVYTDDWRELPAEQHGCIDIGHQFEWAWLLSRAAELGLPANYLGRATRLLDGGIRLGSDLSDRSDRSDGSIRSTATPDGQPNAGRRIYWVQCEALRALIHFAVIRNRADLWPLADRLLEYVRTRFLDPQFGGWYSSVDPGSGPDRGDKGSTWKLDYHIVGLCVEAIRMLGGARRGA